MTTITDKPRCAATSNLEQLHNYLIEHPNEWISAVRLAEIAGALSFRSRLSELRRLGLSVRNRTFEIKTATGRRVRYSEYRLDRQAVR